MALVFDGPNRLIILDETTLTYSAQFIYSRWIDWANQAENAKYLPAFRVVGGDDLGGGATAPVFVFLRNDYGWRIKKPEADIGVTINGNLVKQDANAGFDVQPDGSFSPTLTINLSSVASVDILGQTVTPGFSVGDILEELWRMRGLDATQPVTITPTLEQSGDINIDVTGDGVNTSTLARQ